MTKLQLAGGLAWMAIATILPAASYGRGFGGAHGSFTGGAPSGMGEMHPGGDYFGGRTVRADHFGGANFGAEHYGGRHFGDVHFGGETYAGGYAAAKTSVGEQRLSEGAGYFGQRASSFGGSRWSNPQAPRTNASLTQNRMTTWRGLPSDGGLHMATASRRLGLDQRDLPRQSVAELRRRGDLVRNDFDGRELYSLNWYRQYPGAWYPGAAGYADLWVAASWDALGAWFGDDGLGDDGLGDDGFNDGGFRENGAAPVGDRYGYHYGDNVIYQGGSVYRNGQVVCTADEYYQQAAKLANADSPVEATEERQWMQLGVFALTRDQQNRADLIMQLAVDKAGIIRGNYTVRSMQTTLPIYGAVDKRTQRAAWTIGDNQENVIETGIYNLTKEEAPTLVHFGKDRSESWLLVRLQQDGQVQPNR